MLQIFWFTIVIGISIICLSYVKIRERIPFEKRSKFESIVMIIIILLLVVNVFTIVYQRREISLEMNDCIRFYMAFPNFYRDNEFHFVNKWCYKYFSPEEIIKIRRLGINMERDKFGFINNFNISKFIGGNKNEEGN